MILRSLLLSLLGLLGLFHALQASGDAVAETTAAEATVEAEVEKPAKFKVKGAGLLRNLRMKRQLYALYDELNPNWEATEIEDAALVLISIAHSEGFLNARVIATIEQAEGEPIVVEWNEELDAFLDRSVLSPKVEFAVQLGERFYYDEVFVEPIAEMDVEAITEFYFRKRYLLQGERSKVFTQSRFNSAGHNLRTHLQQQGYREAVVEQSIRSLDLEQGAVSVDVLVEAGPLYRLQSVQLDGQAKLSSVDGLDLFREQPYSDFLRQDIIQMIRAEYYEQGFANVRFSFEHTFVRSTEGQVNVDLSIQVVEGERVTIQSLEFSGQEAVRERLLRSKSDLKEGDLLDPSELQEARLRLSRVGVFEEVEVYAEQQQAEQATVHFDLVERTPWEVDLLAGWGSYERARGGILAERANAFGLGHRINTQAVISTKSLKGDLTYTLPELWNSDYTLSTSLFYLGREELSFDREEIGNDLRLSRYISEYDLDVDTRYIFQRLRAEDTNAGDGVDNQEDVRVGSLEFRLNQNRRNHPLNPTGGYRWYGNLELASRVLGGQVDYQRLELGYSQSGRIRYDLVWHASLEHSVVGSFIDSDDQVPTNKLFYPGGIVRFAVTAEAKPRLGMPVVPLLGRVRRFC